MEFAHTALSLIIVLAAAKVLGEVAERLGQPAVLGELIGGILIGPHVMGLVHDGEIIRFLAEVGAVILLFEVGLESDLEEFLRVGVSALAVAVVGVVLPMGMGYGVAIALGLDKINPFVPLFIGATLAATSVGITARVLSDIRQINSKEARIILGAAVIDDVLGLIVLATVVGIVGTGYLELGSVVKTASLAIGFLAGAILIGIPLAPHLFQVVRRMRSRGTLIVGALIFCLFLAWAAEQLRLAAIVGAFAAGLVLAKTEDRSHISTKVRPLADVFVPIFFVWLGFAVVPSVFNPFAPGGTRTLLTVAVLLLVAVIGKVLAGYAARGREINRLAIGIGMLPRGEVGLIFASVGLRMNIIDAGLYAAVVAIVLLTTVIAPPLLKLVMSRMPIPEEQSVS